MNKKFFAGLLLMVMMLTLLAACERPASVAPATQATATSELPFVVSTQSPFDSVKAGTATAQAQASGGATVEATQAGTEAAAPVEATKAPTEKPKPVLPSPTPGRPSSYTIQEGDHFYCIARRFDVNPGDLMSANGYGAAPQYLQPGTKLSIPQNSSWPSALGPRSIRNHPETYVVQAGDTINRIACKYGDVSPEAILAASGLTSSDLTSGQKLSIP